jgi:hypothetical protein
MRRTVIGALAFALALSASVDAAHAAPKKKAAAKKAVAAQEAPQSAELAKSMGDVKWGMEREALLKSFTDKVREKYKGQLAKANDAMQEDKVRGAMRDELQKLRASVVEFNGTKTGWDASFLKPEFSHNNSESMFVINDGNSQNYYFFLNGKLWKWYKAFNADAFHGKKFEEFAGALQGRFGKAAQREGDLNGQGKQKWLEWQDAQTRARAIDNNQFYGFYSLVFEEKSTGNKLAEVRKKDVGPKAGNSFVDAVTSDDAANDKDNNPDIIDRITGKIRHRQDAPEPTAAGSSGGKSKPAVSASAPAPAATVSEDDDPLKGLL